jgi:hypothetical protein
MSDAMIQEGTKQRKRDGKTVSEHLGGALRKDGGPRREPTLSPAEAAANEKARIKKRDAKKKAPVNFEIELRTHWEANGQPDGNLKQHLTKLYWKNCKSSAAAAAKEADVAEAQEAMALAEEQVAAYQEKQAAPKAPKLRCNPLPLVCCNPLVSVNDAAEVIDAEEAMAVADKQVT